MIDKTAVKLPMAHLRFLEGCESFEAKTAELYHHFERLYAYDAGLARLWRKTALEEENHAQQFDLAIRLQGVGMERVRTDVSQAVTNLHRLEEFMEKIMASKPSPREALALAIRLEEQLSVLHMSSIVVFTDLKLKKLFEAMMDHDKDHVSVLRDALQNLQGN